MTKRDYYEILGVSKTASDEELKRNYRKIAMQCHPDKNPGDKKAEERFKEAAEAYEVLSDRQKREIYDHYGHAGLNNTGFQGFSGFDDVFSNFGDIFEDVFGFGHTRRRGRTRQAARAGADLRYDLKISFLDAAFGITKTIELEKFQTCHSCQGTGAAAGTSPTTCPTCQGRGQVLQSSGFFTISSTCPHCHGQGKFIAKPCHECRGTGKEKQRKSVELKIPAGVETGSRMRLRGEGESGEQGGPSGDLYVFLQVEEHDFFVRSEDDIICRVPISFVQAALGATIEVPTLKDTEKIKIPRGTQNGRTFRLKGKGIPHLQGYGRGDQIIEVYVEIPTDLSRKQEDLLREFEKLNP
ncbi:MAG TPA: molecular chaperone DnaJ [Smithellaceae bacterium]|jgi:molecular chaperone DnaJ|nr:molecular chaperone DnaJ [Smithellaceae bacterium]HOG80843.1 molecular chaperone DnaJ [Smithellaceae bacterium]HOQ42039.1 molecular chaperone DnaJ [Smithellaceae bacterium]HPL65240.1 molecular chaperone DnaJ [Smithellaceae bacterium]HQP23575.1 molecular chaperone DnaJ [Smithellaceae bacterium]